MENENRIALTVRIKEIHMEDLRALAYWQKRSRQDIIDEMFFDYLQKVGLDHRKGHFKVPE